MWYKLLVFFSLCVFVAGCNAKKNKVPSVDRHFGVDSAVVDSFDDSYRSIQGVEKVYFDFDKSNIGDSYEKVLRKVVQKMQENHSSRLMVVGHTDSRGTEEYNMALGERRANSVKNFIVKCDSSLRSRIDVQSKGKTEPEILVVGDEKSPENSAAHAKNRRAVILLDDLKAQVVVPGDDKDSSKEVVLDSNPVELEAGI